MMFKPNLCVLRGVMAVMLAGLALGAMAQTVQPHRQPSAVPKSSDPLATPPAGLKWKWMNEIVFNSTNFASTGTTEERELLSKIWAKELGGTEKNPITGNLYPSFTLIGSVEHEGVKIILTMYDRTGYICEEPGNGKGMVDIYGTCPLRLIRIFSDGQSTLLDIPKDFCMLNSDEPNHPRSKNHTEYGFDESTGIVYLRTIQYGKVVPACNRALRVFKVQ